MRKYLPIDLSCRFKENTENKQYRNGRGKYQINHTLFSLPFDDFIYCIVRFFNCLLLFVLKSITSTMPGDMKENIAWLVVNYFSWRAQRPYKHLNVCSGVCTYLTRIFLCLHYIYCYLIFSILSLQIDKTHWFYHLISYQLCQTCAAFKK